jgi:hypothetical protein
VAQRVSHSVSPGAGASLTLLDEPRLAAPPAAPHDCTLELPVRSVLVGDETVSFATAAAGARTALAIATRTASALFVARGDQSILALDAPFAPESTVSAAGARDTFVLAWADRTAIERRSRPTVAIVDERERLATFALDHQYALAMTEVFCERTGASIRCGFGVGWREEFESTDDVRARFYEFAPSATGATLSFEASPILQRTAPHLVLSTSPLRAHVRSGHTIARYSVDGSLASVSEATIEEAFIAGQLRSLVASAPTSERCQPNRWTLELRAPSEPSTPIGTADARPRGARVRATGAEGTAPIVFWLDEPQCAERAHVVRATHGGQSVVLASASEYDAASDRALVSLAWRDAERVRWARYRCPR